jgi:hypothetical protein
MPPASDGRILAAPAREHMIIARGLGAGAAFWPRVDHFGWAAADAALFRLGRPGRAQTRSGSKLVVEADVVHVLEDVILVA